MVVILIIVFINDIVNRTTLTVNLVSLVNTVVGLIAIDGNCLTFIKFTGVGMQNILSHGETSHTRSAKKEPELPRVFLKDRFPPAPFATALLAFFALNTSSPSSESLS